MTTGTVTSLDGTTIGYRIMGRGPAVVALHGGMLAAQHFTSLADAMSGEFQVLVPDRRGRGLSRHPHTAYDPIREVEDLQALVEQTGATRAFGLSSGALIALRAALTTPTLRQLALYEPPLSTGGSVPLHWAERFERELAAGKLASALVTAFKGLRVEPLFSHVPRAVLIPPLAVALRLQRRSRPDGDVSIAELIPTESQDVRLVQRLADTIGDYAALPARVLLLGGGKSPGYLKQSLDALAATLPHATRTTFADLGHDGPENDGDPRRVARTLCDFFREADVR
jgi:pimeloyl-ACP methyl ester carboxylesterase